MASRLQQRAFGGSRQGIAEAETRKGFAEKAAETVANLRERGFQQAMGAAQFDVGQLAGTEAANVAAQQAAQQFGATSAQAAQAANIARQQQIEAANVAARTGAAQYGAGAQAAEAANIQRAQVAAANAAAQTAASQFGATAAQQAQQQTLQISLQRYARQGAAQQLAGLASRRLASARQYSSSKYSKVYCSKDCSKHLSTQRAVSTLVIQVAIGCASSATGRAVLHQFRRVQPQVDNLASLTTLRWLLQVHLAYVGSHVRSMVRMIRSGYSSASGLSVHRLIGSTSCTQLTVRRLLRKLNATHGLRRFFAHLWTSHARA